MEIFSLDLGNKQTKIKSSKTEKVLPSKFIYHEDLGDDSTALFDQELDVHKYKTNFDPFEYGWGTELYNAYDGKFLDTFTFKERYEKNEFHLLASFAIGELAKEFEDAKKGLLEVDIVTGVPTNDFNKEDVRSIIEVLKKDHSIEINGERLNIRVNEVFVLPQPVGTVYNEMLDSEGYLINDDYQSERVAVIDCGGGTLLIDTLMRLQLTDTGNSQHNHGAFRLYDSIVSICRQNQIHTITETDVELILRTKEDGYFYKENKNSIIDITKHVDLAKLRYTRDLVNTVNTTLREMAKIDTMLFTGGGANLIDRNELKNSFPNAIIINNSEFANVTGFYKYGLANQEEDN